MPLFESQPQQFPSTSSHNLAHTSQKTQQHDSILSNQDVGVVAVGLATSQDKPGVALGAAALLGSGLLEHLAHGLPTAAIHHDYTIHTYRDALDLDLDLFSLDDEEAIDDDEPPLSPAASTSPSFSSASSALSQLNRPHEVSHATHSLSRQVYTHAQQGRRVLTVGGDHSIAIGSVAGSARAVRERLGKGLGVVWIDACTDINTTETTSSGDIHGMPLAFLSGLVKTTDAEPFAWLDELADVDGAAIDISKLVYIGLRDLEDHELRLLEHNNIKAFSSEDVHRLGVEQIMSAALAHIGATTPIHLSVDMAVLDDLVPAPNASAGLSLGQLQALARSIRDSRNLVSMDLVGVDPSDDDAAAARSVGAGVAIVRSAFCDDA